MDTKEEINIELEQILEERRHKLNELSEEEVAKASGGIGDGVVFEKGKWVKRILMRPDEDREEAIELLELKGDELIVNLWLRIPDYFMDNYIVHCSRNVSFTAKILQVVIEIDRPDWAHE